MYHTVSVIWADTTATNMAQSKVSFNKTKKLTLKDDRTLSLMLESVFDL